MNLILDPGYLRADIHLLTYEGAHLLNDVLRWDVAPSQVTERVLFDDSRSVPSIRFDLQSSFMRRDKVNLVSA
jgi:hypothetical protein